MYLWLLFLTHIKRITECSSIQIRKNIDSIIFIQNKFIVPLLLLFIFSCDNGPTEVTQIINPGSRNYTWRVDTLTIPYATVRRMCAISPNDVWAVSWAGNLDSTIYHYDGASWTTDGIYRTIDPRSIFGLTNDDIWMGGASGKIWHFDGSEWTSVIQIIAKPETHISWENIWGITRDDLYAVGSYPDSVGYRNNAVIAHYDGNSWKLIDATTNCGLVRFYKDFTGTCFISASRRSFPDTSKLFLFENNKFTEIYSDRETLDNAVNIAIVGGNVLITFNRNLYTYVNGHFKLLYSIQEPAFALGIEGRNLMDVFLYMKDGLAHYNGIDVQYLFKHNNSNYHGTSIAVTESSVFISFNDISNGKTYIYHGVLKTD